MSKVRDHRSPALASPRRESLRAAAWRLYQVQPLFRGAVDFALIGAVVNGCLFGLPKFDLDLPWLATGSAATAESPARPEPQATRPAPTRLPFTIRARSGALSRAWAMSPSPELRDVLERAADALQAGDPDRAIRVLDGVGEPTHPAVLRLRAAALVGRAHPGDFARALEAAERGAEAGSTEAMYLAGQILRLSPSDIERDLEAAAGWYRRAATAGHAGANNELGRFYETGRGGVSRDLAAARQLYAEAAEAGDPYAQTNYAAMLFNGKGGPRDRAQALRWLERAAAGGDPAALNNLGKIHLDGMAGVAQDIERGLHLLQRAAASGDKKALHHLGRIHLGGHYGRPADPELATAYWREAALRDHGQAQLDLAGLYQAGRGVPRDLVQGYIYASLAARNERMPPQGGVRRATGKVQELSRQLSDEERRLAESLAAIASTW